MHTHMNMHIYTLQTGSGGDDETDISFQSKVTGVHASANGISVDLQGGATEEVYTYTCMCMCVCMHVRVYVCTCVCTTILF